MKKSVFSLLLETAACIVLALLPAVFSLWPQDVMMLLSVLCSYAVYPAASLLLPLITARRGAPAFLCALPPFPVYFLAFLLPGISLPAVPSLLTLLFSVFGASIGAELRNRAK